jgi:phosphohistidine phosphatase
MAPWDETPIVEPMNGLYLASAEKILAIIQDVAETVRSLMVVGHNPGLHDLALRLAQAQSVSSNGHLARQLAEGFPAGALAEFTVAQGWHELGSRGGARLVRFICPRDLPEMAN